MISCLHLVSGSLTTPEITGVVFTAVEYIVSIMPRSSTSLSWIAAVLLLLIVMPRHIRISSFRVFWIDLICAVKRTIINVSFEVKSVHWHSPLGLLVDSCMISVGGVAT